MSQRLGTLKIDILAPSDALVQLVHSLKGYAVTSYDRNT